MKNMPSFGEVLSAARRAKGLSQKELAARVKKEDGQPISPQYLNDVERNRRNPPSEFLIGKFAEELDYSKDLLCLAAGTVPTDVQKLVASQPANAEAAFKAFRKAVKGHHRL
jgi:transcriptional regulator with XRE-family HTH domain